MPVAGFVSTVVFLHMLGWGLAWLYAGDYPGLIGLCGLAYALGLRHAVDADHIAAIDGTIRTLMARGSRPYGVGFFFSLGHSTVVLLMTVAVIAATPYATAWMPAFQHWGHDVGTTIAGLFLYAIAAANIVVLIDLRRVFGRARQAHTPVTPPAVPFGSLARLFGRALAIADRPARMYGVGFLFGLGFDTASEIALLTTAGFAAWSDLPAAAVLALPIVFAAGMSLLDTADGLLMCGAYGWALAHPPGRLRYNVTITGVSALVALVVGTLQWLSLIGPR